MLAILVDVSKCTGCEKCTTACLDSKEMDRQRADADRINGKDGLSAHRLMSINQVAEGHFGRYSCMHCVEPSCVSACLVGGLTKSDKGPVVYDASKCIGCRYCMLACPFHVPRYEWEKATPLVKKCDMCIDRLEQGKQPACVEACPNHVLTFGDRQTLLREAHRRIKADSDRYVQHVWGEEEFGGTCVLYVSDVDLKELGWDEVMTAGIPSMTDPLIEKTPFIGGGVAVGLLAVNWVIQRRMKLAADRSDDPAVSDDLKPGGLE